VPANVVAIWSQSGDPTAGSDLAIGPLTSGFGGAPRGIRTPNRQIRSQASPVPARPSRPFLSPLVLVNGHAVELSRASVPAGHTPHGRNVVAVSDHRRQTGRLVPGRPPSRSESRAPDSGSGALSLEGQEPAARLVEEQTKQTVRAVASSGTRSRLPSQSATAPRRSQLPAFVLDGRLQLPTTEVCL
jgi:hypothetical protein